MSERRGIWERLPDVWKIILAVVGILGLGVTIGAASVGMRGLPQQLETHEQRLGAVEDTVSVLRRDIMDVRTLLQTSLCLEVADRANTDWRPCLTPGVQKAMQ